MDVIKLAVPFFLLAICVEAIYCHIRNKPYFRIADSICSIGTGIFSQLAGVFITGWFFLGYFWAYETFHFFTMDPNSVAVWILLL